MLGRDTELEGEDHEAIAAAARGRGRGRGRGKGRGRGRSASKSHGPPHGDKKLRRLRSKTRCSSFESPTCETSHPQWTEDETKEWYMWQGWSYEEVELWFHGPVASGKRKKDAVQPLKNKNKKSKASKDGENGDGQGDGEEQEEPETKAKEVSFARRPMPTRPSAYTRWSSIKLAFQDKIALYVNSPSKYQAVFGRIEKAAQLACQDLFWKECQIAFKKQDSKLRSGEILHFDLACKTAKGFLRNLPAV